MDYFYLTAPCGLDCFSCHFYLAHRDPDSLKFVEKLSSGSGIPVEAMLCWGCRSHRGSIPLQQYVADANHRCEVFECCIEESGHLFCSDCSRFPCNKLPVAQNRLLESIGLRPADHRFLKRSQ